MSGDFCAREEEEDERVELLEKDDSRAYVSGQKEKAAESPMSPLELSCESPSEDGAGAEVAAVILPGRGSGGTSRAGHGTDDAGSSGRCVRWRWSHGSGLGRRLVVHVDEVVRCDLLGRRPFVLVSGHPDPPVDRRARSRSSALLPVCPLSLCPCVSSPSQQISISIYPSL